MKYVLYALPLILAIVVCGLGFSYRELRQRAEKLANVQIIDGTKLVYAPEPGEGSIIFENVHMEYAPIPILTIKEWSGGGVVGEGQTPSRMQWSCPPGYTLKWDGGIPYCDRS